MSPTLHAQSDEQGHAIGAYFAQRAREGTLNPTRFDDAMHRFFADKLVALDRDKAELCYLLCRALRATRVVEAGTSFGVSTLYFAAAVRDNQVPGGVVIGTEYEPAKAARARTSRRLVSSAGSSCARAISGTRCATSAGRWTSC